MLLLGRWQLARAAEKISLMDGAEQASLASAVELPALNLPVVNGGDAVPPPASGQASLQRAETGLFKRVLVTGTMLADRQFLWDNRIHKGVAGFEVLVPVQLNGEAQAIVLVNRGWVPPGASRSELPEVGLPEGVTAGAEVTIEGVHTLPSRGFAGGQALQAVESGRTRAWPALLQYPDYLEISNALGHPVIVVDNTNIAGLFYANNWSPVANGPEKHYGYAFQWFAMFAALTVIFVVTNSRRVKA